MHKFALAFSLGVSLSAMAHAGTVTDISLSSYYGGAYDGGQWSGEINGASIVAAPTDGNTGTGITFTNWAGRYVEIDAGVTQTIALPSGGVLLNNSAVVNTLFNEGFGINGSPSVNVVFTNNAGASATYGLVSGQTIRDYNNDGYYNTLTGSNSPSYGAVTAQNWWNNGGSGQRLDAQTFVLPSSWTGTDLTSMAVDVVGSGGMALLSALQVNDQTPTSSVPEPMTLSLLGAALGTLALLRRRRAG